MAERICSVGDCGRPVVGRGLCNRHWKQWRRDHSPADFPPDPQVHPKRDLAERFWAKVEKTETCWLWRASVNANGYGRIGRGGRAEGVSLAHRVAYELLVGPIPAGMGLDHTCRVRHCVNPAHLRPAGQDVNTQNRVGASSNSRTGIRNVHWATWMRKYQVAVTVDGRKYYGGFFADLAEAEQAAIALRRRVMPDSLVDQIDPE